MPEWTADDFARAKPASEVLPRGLFESAVRRRRGQRGPRKAPVKKAITLRIDPIFSPATRQWVPAGNRE